MPRSKSTCCHCASKISRRRAPPVRTKSRIAVAVRASSKKPGAKVPSLSAVLQRLGIPEVHRPVLQETFRVMCRLHDEGRDHVWGYYIRNLARPMWLAREPNRVDVLIGNPPWL